MKVANVNFGSQNRVMQNRFNKNDRTTQISMGNYDAYNDYNDYEDFNEEKKSHKGLFITLASLLTLGGLYVAGRKKVFGEKIQNMLGGDLKLNFFRKAEETENGPRKKQDPKQDPKTEAKPDPKPEAKPDPEVDAEVDGTNPQNQV